MLTLVLLPCVAFELLQEELSMATQVQMNGSANGKTAPLPVTKALATFVATASIDQLTPELRAKVKEVVIDYIGVTAGALHNADSTEPIYNAIRTLQGKGNKGNCTVIGKGEPHMLPQYAGLLNSAFGHSLDFDDTHAESVRYCLEYNKDLCNGTLMNTDAARWCYGNLSGYDPGRSLRP